MTTLHVTHGFIGSGKTTFAKRLEREVDAIRFSPDEWLHILYGPEDGDGFYEKRDRISKLVWMNIDKLLELGQDVILDSGYWTKAERDDLRKKAKKNNFDLKIYYVQCPKDVALKRTVERTKDVPSDSMCISESTFNILWERFEPIQEDEDHIPIKNY